MKKTLITGITGQDGSYLAELLLDKGYEVHGLVRSKQFSFPECLEKDKLAAALGEKVHFHQIDLAFPEGLADLMYDFKFDEIYHLAAQSHVGLSFDQPVYTFNINTTGTLRLLEAIRISGIIHNTRLYFAATSEMFGNGVFGDPLNEDSGFEPVSPYAVSKMAAYDMIRQYGKSYGLKSSLGILFNHESPRRHKNFVTRKITMGIARFKKTGEKISLGNLRAVRDWGYAPEYVEAMYSMMQLDQSNEFVIGTGVYLSVQNFLEYACRYAGIPVSEFVDFHENSNEIRPSDVNFLCADSSLAHNVFGWQPKVLPDKLIELMVDADIKFLEAK